MALGSHQVGRGGKRGGGVFNFCVHSTPQRDQHREDFSVLCFTWLHLYLAPSFLVSDEKLVLEVDDQRVSTRQLEGQASPIGGAHLGGGRKGHVGWVN